MEDCHVLLTYIKNDIGFYCFVEVQCFRNVSIGLPITLTKKRVEKTVIDITISQYW